MTQPVTTDALVEARELVRQSLKGGGPGLTEATREAIVRSIMLKLEGKVLAPLLAAHQQVTAERDAKADVLAEMKLCAEASPVEREGLLAELARLRAEGEVLLRAIGMAQAEVAFAQQDEAEGSATDATRRARLQGILDALNGVGSPEIRTALARAATAREG